MKKRTVIGLCCLLAGVMTITSAVGAVQLSLDAASTNRIPISPRIYGVNIANWAADHYARLCGPMLKEAGVSVVRYGATNIERYNWRNNRLYNVISLENQYVPMSWRTFVEWCRNDLGAEPFLQVPAFGQVAADVESGNYNSNQPISEIAAWVEEAGTNVNIWGIGNEPFIAWKLVQYQGEGYKYNDGAHGDQIFLEDLDPNVFYPRWIEIGAAIRGANTNAAILGPTPANWYLYWGTDFSVFCPSTRARSADWPDHWNPDGYVNDAGWQIMADGMNQFDGRVFPGRAGQPGIIGWEQNPQTGEFNDKRNMNMFAKHVAEYAAANGGTQVCSYLDFHRYMNTDNERAAIQETRDLWEEGFWSSDQETGYAYDPRILDRFGKILDHYNPDMGISLSEYDYFYWQGHPDNFQTAALGQADYLGVFARLGVQLACNWYVGEPDQSGGDYHHAADSAKQALFNEKAEPNPKYWALRLMSLNFRHQALTSTRVSDNSLFSLYSGVNTNENELAVVTFYKGAYESSGAFTEGQGATNATMVISNFNITGVKSVQRFGEYDPEIVTMAPGGVTVVSNGAVRSFDYDFEPLAIYAFTFYGNPAPPAQTAPAAYLNVYPAALAFGAFNTGVEIVETEDAEHGITVETNYNFRLRITNNRNAPTTWNVSYPATPWLSVHGATNGEAEVTDLVEFFCDRTGYPVGCYSVDVTIQTSEGTVIVPVSMEVVPGADGGELRICDFDTGSLGHAWGSAEPYAVGFYDQHGQPADMEWPYIYDMSLDYDEVSSLGGVSSMRIDFDRSNGDNDPGCLYTAFGSYGHKVATAEWVPEGQPLSNYVFKFDVKTETEGFGETSTKLLVTVSDGNGDVGKPSTGISDYKGTLSVADGVWQTISTPLNLVFYDWKYPGGQTGDVVNLDFSNISSLSFTPWIGADDKKGTLWIDNIRVESLNDGNRFPVSVLAQTSFEIYTNQTAQLDATGSYDPDGTITNFRWTPSAGLSNPNIANPIFTPPSSGTYVFNLEITDNDGLKGRDAAQVLIYAQDSLVPSDVFLYRDEEMTDQITDGVISNAIDLYAKFVCLSGGAPSRIDTARAVFSSDSLYITETNNNVDPIEVSLMETTTNSLIFTGRFRLAAFSDQSKAELGVQEGDTVTFSNLFYQAEWDVGSQTFGLETIINHIEDGIDGFNNFGGVWYTYDDSGEGHESTITLTNSGQAATPYSTESAYVESVLVQGVETNLDVIFTGVAAKLTPYTEEIPFVSCTDLSSTSGYEGVSFWLKGNGTRVTVVLKSLGVTNYDDYAYTIEATPPTIWWRKFRIPFAWFEQEGWGHEAVARETALRQVNAIQFKFSSHLPGQTNLLWIDDLALFGGDVSYSQKAVYNKRNDTAMDGYSGSLNFNPTFDMPQGGWDMDGVAQYENWEDTTNLLINPTFQPSEGSNLLINSGFEATGGGWTLSGNAAYEDWTGYRLVFENWGGFSGNASQSVGVQQGSEYKFSVKAWKNSTYNGRTIMSVSWYDVSDGLLSSNMQEITSGLVVDTPQSFTLSECLAPAGATTAKLKLESLDGAVPTGGNCVQLDDAVFNETGSQVDGDWELFGNAQYSNWDNEALPYRLIMPHWQGTYGSATQRVDVAEDRAYRFDASALKGDSYVGTAAMGITWYDVSSGVVRVDSLDIAASELLLDDAKIHSLRWMMAPAGAVTAAVAVASTGTSGPAQFDGSELAEYDPQEGDIAWRLTMQHWDGGTGSASQIVENLYWDTEYTLRVSGEKNADYGDGSCQISVIWLNNLDLPLGTNLFTNLQDLMLVGETSVLLETNITSHPFGTLGAKIVIESTSTNGCVQFLEVSLTDGRYRDVDWEAYLDGSSFSFTTDRAEGSGALLLSTTNSGWLCGMYVPPYAVPEDDFDPDVTMTNFAAFDGVALKAKRHNSYTSTGSAQGRVRVAVMLSSNKVASTQWYPVHASDWEDFILFPKNKFYTEATVGDTDPENWVVWDNDWTSVDRIVLEYGPSRNENVPYTIIVDDFRPYVHE